MSYQGGKTTMAVVLISAAILMGLTGVAEGPVLVWLSGTTYLLGALLLTPWLRSRPYLVSLLILAVNWLLFCSWVEHISGPAMGWQGFRHLLELPASAWLSLMAAWPVVFASIALGSVQLHDQQPASRRLVIISAASVLIGLLSSLVFPLSLSGIITGLSFFLFMLCLELYAESEKTTLTWLLFWLLLFASLLAGLAFRHSLQLDQQKRRALLEQLSRNPAADLQVPAPYYALKLPADSLGSKKAQAERIPLQGTAETMDGRRALSWYRLAADEWLIVGRFTGGYRPPLALFSLLFMGGLLLAMAVRAAAWLLRADTSTMAVPLFGSPSLRLRIQLAFLTLTLISFLLIGLFTIQFLKTTQEPLYEWLEQLLTVYVFLLLVAAVIGIVIANSITQPIVEIGEHIRATKLRQNEPLSWYTRDEIGQLVDNYNDMIRQLEDSALRLAASEREEAWRKMAQQIAHEIKNPLTPMKLHLQQLQRLQHEDPEKAAVWAGKIAPALIEQIDALANIAGTFSDFARLPTPDPQTFSLNELLNQVMELYTKNAEGVTLRWEGSQQEFFIHADREHMLRVFSNLLQNAIQAAAEVADGQVSVSISQHNNQKVVIRVTDNGPGVADALRDKIFQPNFTTKSSGMGIGLAISRQMVNQAGGEIGFQSSPGEATTFWVAMNCV